MWGLVHSILVTTPVNVTGLLWSNSAETEWCAHAVAAIASASRPVITVVFMSSLLASCPCLVLFLWLPQLDGAIDDVLQVVLFAGVLHEHVVGRLEPPRAHVHPVLRIGLRVVHGHGVLDRVRVGPQEGVGHLHLLAVRMTARIELR